MKQLTNFIKHSATIGILLFLKIDIGFAKDENTVPDVNHIFGNAYFRSESDQEAAFWMGVASSRCYAAAEVAISMNNRMVELYGDKQKGYFGGYSNSIWADVLQRAKGFSEVAFSENVAKDEALSQRDKVYEMSKQLYILQFQKITNEGYPDWAMFEQDLQDCMAFFYQDKEQLPYLPRE